MNYIQFNQEINTLREHGIALQNRAFLYGDGFFESLIVRDGKILYLSEHYDRLVRAFQAHSMVPPSFLSEEFIIHSVRLLQKKNQAGAAFRLKINIWRKSGGLYTPSSNESDVLISMAPLEASPLIKQKVYFFEAIKKYASVISAFKTLNASAYVLASIEKTQRNADDMILLDVHDQLSECTSSNLFFIRSETVYTPGLECACIDGVLRKDILKICKEHHIPFQTGAFAKSIVLKADFAFTSNIAGMTPIRMIEDTTYPASCALFEKIQALVKENQMATGALI